MEGTSGCPMHGGAATGAGHEPTNGRPPTTGASGHGASANGGPTLPGEGDTDYERYMHIPALLRLQKPEAELGHHDELLFQTIHQAFELWNKLWLFELKAVEACTKADRLLDCYPVLMRMQKILQLNTQSLETLETMTPKDFHAIRILLGQGSGAESPGFRLIQQTAPRLWPHVEAMLQRRGRTLYDAYMQEHDDVELLRFLELLTDVDHAFHVWRLKHLALVKRIIGRDVKSLKGYAVHQLEQDVGITLWPKLWKVREEVTMAMGTSPA